MTKNTDIRNSLDAGKLTGISITLLLALHDVIFLKAIVERYPETALLAGPAEASPEGNAQLRSGALAYQVFDTGIVDETAVEADRTFLGLLLLKAALNNDRSYFPNLSASSFAELRAFTLAHAATDEDKEFLLYSLACNDLGKTQALIDKAVIHTGHKADDHDRLMAGLVELTPELFPGLQRLSANQQSMYRDGLNANFNLGQMVQGENLPANLAGMQAIGNKARTLRLLAELFDFAGATGHVRGDASILLTEDNWFCYRAAIDELTRPPLDKSYQHYIATRAAKVGVDPDDPDALPLGRIAALSRSVSVGQGDAIVSVWRSLPQETRENLRRELSEDGTPARPGILLYYAPAVIANAVKSSGSFTDGLTLALLAFASQYERTRAEIIGQGSELVVTVTVSDMARMAAQDAVSIVPHDAKLIPFACAIEGERVAYIGVGGGSDCVQAGVLAAMAQRPACIISIRTEKTGSQGASGAMGEARTVTNHGGEVAPGIYRITAETTGSGRFLESLPAELGLPIYLVIDKQDGTLEQRLKQALDDFGGVDAIYGVDTGGDSLHRTSVDDKARATPDQDLASFRAIAELGMEKAYSLIVAPGVDSPSYADEVLSAGNARRIFAMEKEKAAILAAYGQLRMDGSDETRIGKTALAWQAALEGKRGSVRLALPDRLVNDPINPWNPIVTITTEMAGAYIMTICDHLAALGDFVV